MQHPTVSAFTAILQQAPENLITPVDFPQSDACTILDTQNLPITNLSLCSSQATSRSVCPAGLCHMTTNSTQTCAYPGPPSNDAGHPDKIPYGPLLRFLNSKTDDSAQITRKYELTIRTTSAIATALALPPQVRRESNTQASN